MLRKRLFWSLTALMVLSISGVTRAQHLQPFMDPCAIDTDFQWFKPLYCVDEEVPERNGFFFAYDRATLNVSRPDQAPGDNNGDWTWGNRFDFGYMTEEAGGWGFTVWKIDSPGEFFQSDFVNRNGVVLADLLGDPIGPITDAVNDLEFYSIEANRIWRLQPLHSGTAVEPLVGLRFMRLTDYYLQEDFIANREGAPVTGPANGAIALLQEDIFTQDEFRHANDLLGGQAGLRLVTTRGRWRLSSDLRGLFLNNFQDAENEQRVETNTRVDVANYDNNGTLQGITVGGVASEEQTLKVGNDVERFVYGGELRLEAALDLTSMFALRFGLEALLLGDGLGRGASGSDEAFTAAGVTFGFTMNR